MRKALIVAAAAWLAVGCGSDSKDESATGGSGGASAGAGGTGSGGTSPSAGGNGSVGTGNGGSGAGTGGSPSSNGGSSAGPGNGGSGSSTMPPDDGSQYALCASNDDCDDGLNCYAFGGYCSTACADDADCSALGDNFSCSMNGGGGFMGGFPGGGMADGGTATPTGVCRATCDGPDDTSCPSGMVCLDVGGGFMGGFPGGGMTDGGMQAGTFRCGYEEEPGGTDAPDGGTSDGGFMGFPGGGFMGGFPGG